VVFFEAKLMANFDHQTLEHLKKLCRIECDEKEGKEILASLKRTLGYIEQLNEVDTDGVKTCRYVLRGMQQNQMREDVEKDPLSREEFLKNAPDQIGGMIRVPVILKQGS
jgi:aspartyl-tRNA(Asn)/glutamyl-tRNA(Gln) amidotransferase subunit C